jgi:hypothetical protein
VRFLRDLYVGFRVLVLVVHEVYSGNSSCLGSGSQKDKIRPAM